MCLDHSKATVRITLDGLLLFCFKKNSQMPGGREHCEIGILDPPLHRHKYNIQLKQLMANGEFVNKHLEVDQNDNIFIEVFNLDTGVRHPMGIETFPPSLPPPSPPPSPLPAFNRKDDVGDQKDFRWWLDLENPSELHSKVKIKNVGLRSNRLFICGGTFYTHMKSYMPFNRVLLPPTPATTIKLGKIASIVGIDIVHPKGCGIRLRDSSKSQELPLAPAGNFFPRYEIVIKNIPPLPEPGEAGKNHFRFYYEAVRDAYDGKKFELEPVEPSQFFSEAPEVVQGEAHAGGHEVSRGEDHAGSHQSSASRSEGTKGIYPLICDPAYLSQHDELK